jgi:hypothetical protein
MPARILAAADCYHTMTESRADRDAFPPDQAVETVVADARAGRLDAQAVAAVVEAAGHKRPQLGRPAGLTPRQRTVVGLLAQGLRPSRSPGRSGSRPRLQTPTSSTRTGRWVCRRELARLCSPCATASPPQENS